MSTPSPTNERITAQYHEFVTPIWKSLDILVKRASGCALEDFDGNEYLDLFSGISVTNAGHRNDVVVDTTKAQLDNFIHGCSYVHPNQPVAEKLADVTPDDDGPMGAPAPDDHLAKEVSHHLREQGIVIGVGGFYGNVMRFQPPLTISREQLETAVSGLRTAIEEVST